MSVLSENAWKRTVVECREAGEAVSIHGAQGGQQARMLLTMHENEKAKIPTKAGGEDSKQQAVAGE